MLYPEAADFVADNVKPEIFFRAAHRIVFAAVKALRFENAQADLVSVRQWLGAKRLDEIGGTSYLASLIDGVPRRSNLQHYLDVLVNLFTKRELLRFARELSSKIVSTDQGANAIMADADRTLLSLQTQNSRGNLTDLRESSTTLMDDLQGRIDRQGQLTGVETGFPSINEMTLGWNKGDLIVLAARPSIGKTTFALNTAMAGAQAGSRVAVFSLEMRRIQLEYRILAALSGVPLTRFLGGFIAQHDFAWPQISDAIMEMGSVPIYIDDTGGRTYWDIRAACRRLRSEGGLDVVIIDYVQLMPGTLDRRGSTRNEEVTDISRRLKTMADELNVAVILLSQLNRGAEGRSDPRPKLTDLRESGALEQDADLVCFIHRKNHKEDGVNQFIIEKQRNGPTGTRNITLTMDICRFTDGGDDPPPPTAEQLQAEKNQKAVQAIRRRTRKG